VIGTKWFFVKKLNEDGQVTRNKAILVSKGYTQVEGIDFEETFSLVSRMEEIGLILAYVFSKNIKVYQMDVKSISKWRVRRISIHQASRSILVVRKGKLCL
jgi:hypothetical protein